MKIDDIWSSLKSHGPIGIVIAVLLIIIILIVQEPDRAEKLKILLLNPLFRLFKFGSKQYIAGKVGTESTDFFKKDIGRQLLGVENTKITIKWVVEPSDPVLTQDGTLILRLTDTNDQTRNILLATKSALPKIICPTIRNNINKPLEKAIDLTLLNKLADRLGKHSFPVFQKYFLAPEITDQNEISQLFHDLRQIDRFGLFISIFIQEIDKIGAWVFANGDTTDKTKSIQKFLEFLLTLAKRQPEEIVPLDFISDDIHVSIMLLAKSLTAESMGIAPYVSRINQKIKFGAESIYIITYPSAREFLTRLLVALSQDNNITMTGNIGILSYNALGNSERITLTTFQTKHDAASIPFAEKIQQLGILQGNEVTGLVIDVSQNLALIKVDEIDGIISSFECSWGRQLKCSDQLKNGEQYKFLVKSIDTIRNKLILTRRLPSNDPWHSKSIPNVGDIVHLDLISQDNDDFIGHTADGLEIIIPKLELSWTVFKPVDAGKYLHKKHDAIILEKSETNRTLIASIKRVDANFWRETAQRLPKGTKLSGIVSNVYYDCVKIELANGLEGSIPRQCMQKGGYEYEHFEKSLAIGQGLDIVIIKVNIGGHAITCDLARNFYGNKTDKS